MRRLEDSVLHERQALRRERYVEPEPMSGCWIWIGTRNPTTGYGQALVGRRLGLMHRVFYEQARGAIPEGFTIDHLCRLRACVNPAHMEVVTSGVNTLRGEGPSAVNARLNICRRGHPLSEAYLWDDGKSTHRQCRRCRTKRDRRRKGKDVSHSA